MMEQLLKEAEFRTFGDAVILMGTVHVALNDAERCTGMMGGVRGAEGNAIDGRFVIVGMGGGMYGLNGFFFGDGVHELNLC